jgi:hypothetical protein
MRDRSPWADVVVVVVDSPLSDESALTDDLWTYQDLAHRWFAVDGRPAYMNAPTLSEALVMADDEMLKPGPDVSRVQSLPATETSFAGAWVLYDANRDLYEGQPRPRW